MWQKQKSITMALFFLVLGHPIFAQDTLIDELVIEIKELRKEAKVTDIDQDAYASLLNDLGGRLRFINPDSLLLISKEALSLSKQLQNKNEESRALSNIAGYYSDKGDHSEAIGFFKSSLTLAKEINNTELILNISNNLATEHMYNGDYSRALNGFLETLELAQALGDKIIESIVYEDIANLYVSQKDYDQALYFYHRVEEINKGIDDNFISAQTLSNLAYTYTEMGNFRSALQNVEKSIAIFRKSGELDWLAYSYLVKGRIYLMKKNYSLALYWFNESELLHKELQDERGTIDLYNGMAEAFFALNEDSLAMKFALKSYGVASKINSMGGIKIGAQTLYKLYKKEKNYATALSYHEIFQKISDTLSRKENNNSLTLLKTEITHKNQKEELIKDNEKALAKHRNFIYFSILVIVIMGVAGFFVARAQKLQKRLNHELQTQKRDLEQRKLELQASNETKNKLFSIIAHDLRGPIGALESVLKMLNTGDMDSSEFMAFVPKLKNDVNNLSFTLNNLLSWGQSQMNVSTTNFIPAILSPLVQTNIDLLNELASSKNIKVDNLIPEDTCITVDENQLNIVLRNLLSNAIKFTPNNGNITFDAKEKDEYIEISVKDTGKGIPQNIQEKLLQENSNYSTYGTNNEKGTGLGLSLCKEMVGNNGGRLWVESEIDKGSTFYFTIPNCKCECKKSA